MSITFDTSAEFSAFDQVYKAMRKKNKVPQSWNLSKEPIPGRI
jgi:hypothetical protein